MVQHFINRKEELTFLNEKYRQSDAQLIVIYGRRRVGKTQLLLEFAKNKENIYYLSEKTTIKRNIDKLKNDMAEFLDPSFKKIETDDFEELFAEFVKWKDLKKNKEKIVLIIDEFSYLIELSSGVTSVFQKIWDLILKDREDIYLVLCGSSIGLMKNEVLGRNSPLYGRRTGQWKVNDIEISHIRKFLPKYSFEDILRTCGIVGGVPFYLNKWDCGLTVEENIKKEFITKGGFFLEEAKNLLREDFREPRNYMLILSAISEGKNKFGEIANYAGLDKSALSRYLEILQTLDIVTFEIPLFSSLKEKKRHYLIKDNYFNFWFRFIYNNIPKIEANREKEVMHWIKTQFNSYFGFIFEEMS
ncbi:MAG: ATP-binding protein, partial [Candidatus Aenigmarchaeota archaeon]|nr:ATP-binding protein [Candidatus Aenigmarchaeota archaeon]